MCHTVVAKVLRSLRFAVNDTLALFRQTAFHFIQIAFYKWNQQEPTFPKVSFHQLFFRFHRLDTRHNDFVYCFSLAFNYWFWQTKTHNRLVFFIQCDTLFLSQFVSRLPKKIQFQCDIHISNDKLNSPFECKRGKVLSGKRTEVFWNFILSILFIWSQVLIDSPTILVL